MLKVKASGSYLRDRNSRDYDVEVIMPDCPDNYVQWAVMRRAVPLELHKQGMPFDYLRSCYLDKVEKIADDDKAECMAFAKKPMNEYTQEDCQNCAIYFQLLEVPMYKSSELRETRSRTFKSYLMNVKGMSAEDAGKVELDGRKVEMNEKPIRKKTKKNSEVLEELEK